MVNIKIFNLLKVGFLSEYIWFSSLILIVEE